jgi:ABC-type transport system substrate-binding protein
MYNSCHWTHNPNLKPVKYDPELSRKLLAEAGYEKGLTIKGYYGNDADSVTRAEAIKAMLLKVGINWKVEFLDSVAGSDRMKNREYDMAGGGWSWIWDPDLMATGLYMPEGGFNYGRSDNKAVQALILKGRSEVDVKKRQKIYWEIERLLYENYEDAWLYWPISTTAYSKNVQGWNNDYYLKGREGTWFSHPMWLKDGGKGRK